MGEKNNDTLLKELDICRKRVKYLEKQNAIYYKELQTFEELSKNELKKERDILEAILESIPGLLYIFDNKGRLLKWNNKVEELTEYSSEELFHKKAVEFFYEGDRRNIANAIRQCFEDGSSSVEARLQSKSGNKTVFYLTGRRLILEEKKYLVGVGTDITERLNAEEAIRKKKEAEFANKTKSELLANISHDIRTPLTAITGITELLTETPLSNEQKNYVHMLATANENLLHLVDSIIDISKIESNCLKLNNVNFNICENIEKTCNLITFQTKKNNIKFEYKIKSDIPLNLTGDVKRLMQILINLLCNAIKFTKEGSISLEVSVANLTGETVTLLFCVSDTGIGIPANKLDAIFDKFNQIDSIENRKNKGAGLGLAICKNLVELMGGKIWVESELGVGSKFYFSIPFQTQSSTTPKLKKPTLIVPQKLKILIVEDDKFSRAILKEYFNNTPYKVDTAENGQIAVEKSISNKYNIIFMDIQMPVMDGLLATKIIREHENTTNSSPTPIIALTASAFKESVENSTECYFNDYITKPVKRKRLLQAIYEHTGKQHKIKYKKDDLYKSFMPELIEDIKNNLNTIYEAMDKKNFPVIAEYAHKIKGSAGFYGLNYVSKLACSIVDMAREKNEEEVEKYIDKVSKHLNKKIAKMEEL